MPNARGSSSLDVVCTSNTAEQNADKPDNVMLCVWWQNHEQLLNQLEPTITSNISAVQTELQIDSEPITHSRISKAVRLLNNIKAAGPNGILAEILMADISIYIKCQL